MVNVMLSMCRAMKRDHGDKKLAFIFYEPKH